MRRATVAISLLVFVLFGLYACQQEEEVGVAVKFYVPSNFPKPVYDFSKNPITTEGFKLGKALFHDPILSRDGTISCSFCHIQSAAFTQHGHALSHGIDDKLTLRNSLPIMNLAWKKEFFWDGGVFHLDLFAVAPIEAPNEMDESLPNVLEKLRKHPKYPSMFERAFGTKEINTERFLKALSQFQLMCISGNSKYDKYVRKENGVTLTSVELEGLSIFKQKCASCHAGELFTDFSYRNNGLPVRNREDTGRERITLNENDRYKFMVPSLRNVAMTYPYMHDGRFTSLFQVLDHYSDGIVDSP
ncbi:MAG: cytochrome-c peroxidase, partial [Flammeovirgaceae bacterium]|nr:cytochrome-c peroxidase [Flammeovirgaceae bacterium]